MILRFTLFLFAFLVLGCASQSRQFQNYEAAQKSGICNIHHIQMYKENVEIGYGLVVFPPGGPSPETVASQFPHADHFVLGGCVISKDSPTHQDLYICPMCEKAQKLWLERDEYRKRLQFVPKKA